MEAMMSTSNDGFPTVTCDEMVRISEAEQVLSFENFVQVMNNFRLHFCATGFCGNLYRGQSAYCACMKSAPGFRRLAYCLRGLEKHNTGNYFKKLYKAYKMMRPYASSNWEMFM